jgi:hypothetical protein
LIECDSEHTPCKRDGLSRAVDLKYPVRMLDITSDSIVLYEGSLPNQYACLSHCWGTGAAVTKTTSNTIEAFAEGIPWVLLPLSFQDAIDICRKLDIRFLWIDSLCIIQDSNKDWQEQASQMADIYSEAYVTIAATKAENPSQGCYTQTDKIFFAERLPGYETIFIRGEPPDVRFGLDGWH